MLAVGGCAPKQGNTIERLAIVPANILISDASSEWMSLAVALALEQDLVTSRRLVPILAAGESSAYERGANEILRTIVETRNGRIRLQATITDLSTQRNRAVIDVGGPSSEPLDCVNALAKRIDPQATAFSTRNDRAWQAYTGAAASSSLETRTQMLHSAVAGDPAFGLAYLVWAETLAQAGQNPAAVLNVAASHRGAFTPLDKVRFDALMARTSHAPLAEQEKTNRAVLELAPNDVDALATLGSVRFIEGNAGDGERLLKHALELSPGNVNIRTQLAEGLFESRRFADAEKIFTGLNNNPSLLPGLALCILLEGDVARANTVFSGYLKQRASANDPLLFLAEANWIAISKQPTDGVQFLARNNLSQDDFRSLAFSQSAIWQLLDKDSAGAKKSAASALELAKAPVPKLFGTVSVLIADGDEPLTQWRERVGAAPLTDSIKHAVLAYGLFLNARYPEAVEEWQDVVKQSGNADLRARAMLAASLDRAGRAAEAHQLKVEPFTPNLIGADQFAVVTFDEMRRILNLGVH